MIRHSIEAWIVVGDRILLLHVLREKGDFWQPITGGIEAGESAEAAAVREITEETGLVLPTSALTTVTEHHRVAIENDPGLVVDKTLFFTRSAPWEVVLSPSEHDGWTTVAVDEVLPQLRWNHDTWAMVRPLVEAALD